MENEKTTDTIKLAVTISGAVSLGSFEAGALYELLHTIENYNSRRQKNQQEIKIDILTGASAGGMTAAIAAKYLLYDAKALKHQTQNPLYQAWVESVDLDLLVNLDKTENPGLSILSSNLVRIIADLFLSHKPAGRLARHSAAADEIKVGLALSNLSGVDYSVDVWGGQVSAQKCASQNFRNGVGVSLTASKAGTPTSKFIYTEYADHQTFKFRKERFSVAEWKKFIPFVISCGAFPFAFRPVEISVPNEQYYKRGAEKPVTGRSKYAFVDGGVFQNEPLGLAKRLVELEDGGDSNNNRFYVYIAPGLRGSSTGKVALDDMNAITLARFLGRAIFCQSRFQDWIDSEKTNERLAIFNKRVLGLKDRLLAGDSGLTPENLMAVARPMLEILFNSDEVEIEKKIRRLRTKYREELKSFGNEALANAWLETTLAFETAAELGNKDEMKIFGITADEDELAGAGLFAFTGFFARKLRAHDYAVGRKKAREVMSRIEQIAPFVDQDEGQTKIEIDGSLSNFDLLQADVDPAIRAKLGKAVDRCINYVLHSFPCSWVSVGHLLRGLLALVGAPGRRLAVIIITLLVFTAEFVLGMLIADWTSFSR